MNFDWLSDTAAATALNAAGNNNDADRAAASPAGTAAPDVSAASVPAASEAGNSCDKAEEKELQPVLSSGEIRWSLRDNRDLSDVPEPLYQIACYLQKACSFLRSKNRKDLLQVQPACDLFYDDDYTDEEKKETYPKRYDPDAEPNIASFAAFEIEELNPKCSLKYRRFKAENRKEDGLVHASVSLLSCSSKKEPCCYLARNCNLCLANIASYIYYLRQTNPEEEKRQRANYALKAMETYEDLEPLLFHFSDNFLEKIKISSISLRFAKRMIDMGAAIPHVSRSRNEDNAYRVVLAYPLCLDDLFSKDYRGEFSEEYLLKICEGNPVIPYYFRHTITIPSQVDRREEFFLDVFNGQIINNVDMLFCLLTFVYDLLQQKKYVSYLNGRLRAEAEAVKEIDKEFRLGENIRGFYGSIVGSDKMAIREKAEMLSTALQVKSPYLSSACASISITDFMEFLMSGAGEGFSDSFNVTFTEPKTNMIYILDGLSFWLRYPLKFTNPDYTHNRSRMLEHCLRVLRDYRPNSYIILTGDQKELDEFMKLDITFSTLFKEHQIVIPSDSPEELFRKFTKMMEGTDMYVGKNEFMDYVSRNTGYFPFKNDSLACYLSDCVKSTGHLPADFNTRNNRTFEEALNDMVGLEDVKEQMIRFSRFVRFVQQAKEFKMDIPASNYHMLFTGNPGTGKTTVARIVAKMLYHCGVCKKDKFTEIQSTDMVAKYLGQTGPKTKELIENAMDGVLFIDEAYAITDGSGDSGANDYGKEALSVLIKMMEDHKDRLVVIFAGYKDQMEKFVNTNPGMKSRIGYTFEFHDYSDEELVEIFCRKVKKAGFVLEDGVRDAVLACIKAVSSRKDFGNGRFIDKLFQEVLVEHAVNLKGIENLKILSVNDVPSKEKIVKNVLGDTAAKTEIGFKFG